MAIPQWSENELKEIHARAGKEGWSASELGLVVIGKLDPDVILERRRIAKEATRLRGLAVELWRPSSPCGIVHAPAVAFATTG